MTRYHDENFDFSITSQAVTAFRIARNIGAFVVIVAIILGLSYCSERPKYQFFETVTHGSQRIPGARLISSSKSSDLTSPVSWIWPATTRLIYARPDINAPTSRFYIMSFGYNETPEIWLAEPDCQARKQYTYFPANPGETGDPARDIMGKAIVAPNGKRFLRHDTNIQPNADQLHALCDTDWTVERNAIAASSPRNQ